jgi:hypothetical protein
METQQSPLSRTARVTARAAGKALWKALRRPISQGICALLLIGALGVSPAGSAASHAHAASARPHSCPTSYSPGAANCVGSITATGPGQLQPPGGPVYAWDTWTACVSLTWLENWFLSESPEAYDFFETGVRPQWNDWNGNWIVTMAWIYQMLSVTNPIPYQYDPAAIDTTPKAPCPPYQPPPITSLPQIQTVYFNFWAYAPEAVVSGSADCPASSPPGSWCPPSVGEPVHLTVTNIASPRGSTQSCTQMINLPGLYDYVLCMRWTRGSQTGGFTWDFDDAQVDPTSGQARQVSGVNYNVSSALGQTVSHTFQYSSAFDPLRGCVRPCPGDLLGAPMAGYPQGTPAFQVSVSSNWFLQFQQCLNGLCGAWQNLDLRRFGSPTSYFTSVTTVPLFVLSYGSVTP